MWEFLMGLFIGDTLRKSPLAPFIRLLMKLAMLGILISGLIYAYVVCKAVLKRSEAPHVHARSAR